MSINQSGHIASAKWRISDYDIRSAQPWQAAA